MDNWNGIISLLIACIEFILLVNVMALAQKTKPSSLAIVMITLLFIYQLLEFLMCHYGLRESYMAYLAFADISFLPPLGLYLVLTFLEYPVSKKTKLIFSPAVFFVIYYALTIKEFKVASCTVLYATYNYPLGDVYGILYYSSLVITMILLYIEVKRKDNLRKTFLSKVLLTGYTIISIPVVFSFLLAAFKYNFLLNTIESVMCKFALALALCLSFFCLYDRKVKPS